MSSTKSNKMSVTQLTLLTALRTSKGITCNSGAILI